MAGRPSKIINGSHKLQKHEVFVDYVVKFTRSLKSYLNVLLALMLRDMRTRFFGHGLGYLIAIGWPLVHIGILLVTFHFTGRTAPFGDNLNVFFATGLVPFITWSYMSRFVMFSSIINRPLLAFPAVKSMDVLIARGILEAIASCCMTLLLLAIFWILGIDARPYNIVEAYIAFSVAILLGFGFGLVNGVVALVNPMWLTGYSLLIIAFYLASGIVFVPDLLPEQARVPLSYNPILQAVEWMRVAYYPGYSTRVLDKPYTLAWAFGSIFFGLVLERLARGRLLQG